MSASISVSLNRVASRLAQVCAPVRNVLLAASMIFLVTGCATSGNPKDPLEGFNRAMFALNDGLDQDKHGREPQKERGFAAAIYFLDKISLLKGPHQGTQTPGER